jgi:pimeloyl-ACP methyl ester carboxylesterase
MTPRFATVPLATGPRIHYAEYGSVDGEPILFLHGWPDSWFSYSRVLELLPARYRTFAIDQRGYGESEKPAHGYAIANFVADAAAFLDAVSVERATVVGHSFGSFVARRLAITHPNRVSRLVLIGTGASASNPVTRDVQGAMRNLPDQVPIEFARDFQSGTVHAPVPEAFFERIVAESMKLPGRLWRASFDALLEHDGTAQWDRLTMPMMFLWGERDALFPREDQDRLVSAIPGATLKVYEDTGHCPNWERPERVAADIDAFIRKADPG